MRLRSMSNLPVTHFGFHTLIYLYRECCRRRMNWWWAGTKMLEKEWKNLKFCKTILKFLELSSNLHKFRLFLKIFLNHNFFYDFFLNFPHKIHLITLLTSEGHRTNQFKTHKTSHFDHKFVNFMRAHFITSHILNVTLINC